MERLPQPVRLAFRPRCYDRNAAMGYGDAQVKDLEATIARSPADLLVATPIDPRRVMRIEKPALRVGYELQEIGKPDLEDALRPLFGPRRPGIRQAHPLAV